MVIFAGGRLSTQCCLSRSGEADVRGLPKGHERAERSEVSSSKPVWPRGWKWHCFFISRCPLRQAAAPQPFAAPR